MIFVTPRSSSHLDDFVTHHQDRTGNHGSVAIYTQNGLSVSSVDTLISPDLNSPDCEQIWRSVKYGLDNILIGCIYRPPPSAACSDDEIIFKQIVRSVLAARRLVINKQFDSLLITGDFNLPNVKWLWDGSVSVYGPDNNPGEVFIDTLADQRLTQVVNFPTFIQAHGSCKNTLDYIISKNPLRVKDLFCDAPLGTYKQAHVILRWKLSTSQKPIVQFSSTCLNFSKGNYTGFNEDLGKINWKVTLDGKSVDSSYEAFLDVYHKACLKWIPKKDSRKAPITRRAPWLTINILDLTRNKTQLWKLNQATGWKITTFLRDYKTTRDKIRKECKKAKRKFEMNLAMDKKNPKRLFAYFNNKQEFNSGIEALTKDGKTT